MIAKYLLALLSFLLAGILVGGFIGGLYVGKEATREKTNLEKWREVSLLRKCDSSYYR